MIQSLKQVYDINTKQIMSFIEHVRLLSLLPCSWKYEKVMDIFGCTRRAVTAAHQMYDDEKYLLNRHQESTIRQRAHPEKIKHFVSWLVASNTLVSGRILFICHTSFRIHLFLAARYIIYGLTTIRMNNGENTNCRNRNLESRKQKIIRYNR